MNTTINKLLPKDTKIGKYFSGLILGCALATQSVAAQSKVSDADVYRLMDKSGTTRMIEALPMQMVAMGQQMSLTAKDPAKHKQFMEAFTSSIKTDKMLQIVAENLGKNANTSEVKELLSWMNTDLAVKVLNAESAAYQPDFEQNLMRYMADLQSNPPTQARTQAILSYVESTEMVDQGMKVVMSVIENMFAAFKAAKPGDAQFASMLDGQLGQMETMMRPAFEQQMVMSSYYIYRDISEEDLSNYGAFFKTELGSRYMTLIISGVSAALDDWGGELAKLAIDHAS